MFPLGTVLFPGLVLPLHIFEERYRDAGARPDGAARTARRASSAWSRSAAAGRRSRAARRAGQPAVSAALTLHEVGCTAELRQVTEHPDGRFDIVTVGRRRFRITGVDGAGRRRT